MPRTKNRIAAGKRFEKQIADFLVSLGWRVERANPKLMFLGPGRMISKAHDFFGNTDHIAVHPGVPFTLFIQASLDSGMGPLKMRKMDEMAWNAAQRRQVWLKDRTARGRIIVHYRLPDRWEERSFRMQEGAWPESILGPCPSADAILP